MKGHKHIDEDHSLMKGHKHSEWTIHSWRATNTLSGPFTHERPQAHSGGPFSHEGPQTIWVDH
jgi:hypothetical protein